MNFSNIRLNRPGSIFLVIFLFLLLFYYLRGQKENDLSSNVDLRRLLIGGIQAATEGGRRVVEVYNSTHLNVRSKGLTKEGANNPVTEADLDSHCVMFYGLRRLFPAVKIISEEQVGESSCIPIHNLDLDPTVLQTNHDVPVQRVPASDVTVWIDPLDATQEFTEKLVEYVTTMVCIAVKGVPTVGIIHFPFSGKTFWAWVGHHSPSEHAAPKNPLKIITSRSHKGDVAAVVKKALGNDVVIIPAGGAGYKSLQVASGNASAYVHTTNIKKWDICSGDAVLRALGGSMTTLTGAPIEYGSDTDVVNPYGLLATLKGHSSLLKQFAPVLSP